MFKKAQAAMEFLMTYGWAILVVLAAIGALAYFGVLSPGNLLPQKCEFSSGVDCTETPSASAGDGEIVVALTNSQGYDAMIDSSSGTITGDGVGCTLAPADISDKDTDGVWENGEPAVFYFQCGTLPEAGDRYKGDVSFTYVSNVSTMEHTATGRVAGKVGA